MNNKFDKNKLKEEFIKYFGEEKWFEEEALNDLFPFIEYVCNDLKIAPIPITFDENILDDSRLVLEDEELGPHILLSTRITRDFITAAKGIAHELKHLHQYIVMAQCPEHPLREKWLDNLAFPVVVTDYDDIDQISEYASQPIEVDAFAYQFYIVNKYYKLDLHHPSDLYDLVLQMHAKKYFK